MAAQEGLITMRNIKEVSTDGLRVIGSGGLSTVYAFSEDTLLKLYPSNMLLTDIEREEKSARAACDAGISTAGTYGIVRSGDQYGILFEWVKGDLLADLLMKNPSEVSRQAPSFGRLLHSLHTTGMDASEFPSTKDIYREYLTRLNDWYTEEEIAMMRLFLDAVPDADTMIHSDFHTKNIIIRDQKPVLIDMAELSLGHPIFDLSAVYDLFVLLAQRSPSSVERFTGISPELSVELWNQMIRVYADTDDPERIHAIEGLCADFSLFRIALSPAIYVRMSDGIKSGRVNRSRDGFLSNIKEHIERLAQLGEAF